ncbi:MAG: exonuclease domain-containing protein [Pilosibacter sp.]
MKNFIVFDLEWNQNPGGKEASVERLPFEIFEIGAVKLNEEREKVAEFHRIIRPCVYRQMHRIISEVTHVSIEELERDGEPFAAVMEDFLKWCGEDCIFCTWGSMDLTELQRNMVYHGMTIPFPKPFLFMMSRNCTACAIRTERREFRLMKRWSPLHLMWTRRSTGHWGTRNIRGGCCRRWILIL